ncbi:methyltransferase-like protein 27 isoform X2 [Lingula anatina]|nr:methyltransferase-like protein 27 isoform X2 [Lingula anatina]XP_023931222.1 methyltransferase-like protein 27 isoform X2 [Lingula anatina]|eukprot:XP_013392059.1 methyltransferase-like protein 27 isoform X2 [Lingula anatina]
MAHYEKGMKDVPGEDIHAYNTNYSAHREGIAPEEMVEIYNKWGENYEKDFAGRYNGPVIAATSLAEHFEKGRRDAYVLDVAAGTGMVGEQLHHRGFTAIDGLDPSKTLLNIAERKNIYGRLINSFITSEPTASIEEDTYDAIVISGGMGEGHIKCSALNEMIRIVKKGGLICIVMREEYLDYVEEYKNLEPYMKQLEIEGKWEKMERKVVPNYSFQKNGIVFTYKVL